MYSYFSEVYEHLRSELRSRPPLRGNTWQGRDVSSRPEMETQELLNTTFDLFLPDEDLGGYARDIMPDLPWADDHFEERVCGAPLNPGVQYAKWRMGKWTPGFQSNSIFNHNYMERIWPKFAGRKTPMFVPEEFSSEGLSPREGIRYPYGDLNDVIDLLARDPMTRQAFLPVFFPEDTGAVHKDRTPCTIGWGFIQRDKRLHITYFLRSCDFVNHFRNDVYMAIRLGIHVLQKLREKDEFWDLVTPGSLHMDITSLHVFKANRSQM